MELLVSEVCRAPSKAAGESAKSDTSGRKERAGGVVAVDGDGRWVARGGRRR